MSDLSIKRMLIANRGEIAVRIMRACRELGVEVVCVYSEADADAAYLGAADAAVCIGRAASRSSYLNAAAIVQAALLHGADAIHPGYGFLSENPDFVDLVVDNGLVFVGPGSAAMRTMGDKVAAKRAMRAAGVPCVPGPDSALPENPAEALAICEAIGLPLIIKAAGGGGGRGMRVVRSAAELAPSMAVTREEAARYFSNPSIYVERFLEKPRHIEIQVMCDRHGNGVWLGARDCSLQRRNQKVIEEAPVPGVPAQRIAELGRRCVEACATIGYVGAGTFEFLYEDGAFNFIEMNTRIQVEHPVTELTSGYDLVQLQIMVAAGMKLPFIQDEVGTSGHAIECRINAEDPFAARPSPGTIESWTPPTGDGVRVDTHVYPGYRIPPSYDSLIAKLVVHADDRAEALSRMRVALSEFEVAGVKTNVPLHRELIEDPGFVAGGVDIHHLARLLEARS